VQNTDMPLPIQPLPLAEHWDCHQCGACCRGSIVPLSDEELAQLKAQGWHDRPEFKNTLLFVRDSWFSARYRLAHRPDGSCVFLSPDGLCRIHQEFGAEAKPLVCRMFPLQIVPRDNVAMLTIRRACPSAAADRGRPVAEHVDFARQLARQRPLAEPPAQPPAIKPGDQRPWQVARRLLETIQRLLTDERFPPVRRLVHALILSRLLEQAQTRPLADQRLIELFSVLEKNIADEVGDLFSQRDKPSAAALVLFRQSAAEFVRLHPGLAASPGWIERWNLAVAAWKLVRGRGQLPRLHPSFPNTTFDRLEAPFGVLDAAIYQPLSRWLETSAVSWSYALENRRGWSIIESLRMLALSYPTALWLLRWRSAGGLPQPDYMPDLIAALDRAQGYAPLAGPKQRHRLQLLARLEQLERLVIWYAR
jgi:lysine-N-methylase